MSRTWDFLNQLDEAEKSGQNIENLISDYLKIALEEAASDRAVNEILTYVGKTLGADRAYIFEKNAVARDDNTYEWTANDVEPEKEGLQNLPEEIFANWYEAFYRGEAALEIQDIEALHKTDVMKYAILKMQHIKALAAAPIRIDKEIIGFLGIDNPTKTSLQEASGLVQIMAHFVAALLKQRSLGNDTGKIIHTDMLTGLGNRYAMEAYAQKLSDDSSIGAVYCDVTGLERVNDILGRTTGDAWILQTCEGIKEVFGEQGVFRVGGDEFIVLCTGCAENLFLEKVQALKYAMKKRDVPVAIGAVWKPKFCVNFNEILFETEHKMFADKAEYYKKMG